MAILDQSQLIHNASGTKTTRLATQSGQSFIAGMSGNLVDVAVWINKTGDTSSLSLIMELYLADINDEPTGGVLATETILDININNGAESIFTFSSPYSLNSGTKYFLLFKDDSTINDTDYYIFVLGSGDPYPNGKCGYNESGTWNMSSTYDLYFKTWVAENEELEDIINDFRMRRTTYDISNKFNTVIEIGDMIYISNADIDDEDMTDISDWTDADSGGISSQITFDGKSCMKLDSGSSIGGVPFAKRWQDIGSFGSRTVFSFNIYFDELGTKSDYDFFTFTVTNGNYIFVTKFASDGLRVRDDITDVLIDSNIVVQDTWQEWTFDVDWANKLVDIYLDKILKYSNVSCNVPDTGTEGTTLFLQYGHTTANRITYIDWFKAGSNFILPDINNEFRTRVGLINNILNKFSSSELEERDIINKFNSVWEGFNLQLDQQQIGYNAPGTVEGATWRSQIFRAGLSGLLGKIVLRGLYKSGTGDAVIEIQGVDGESKPDGNILATQTILQANVPLIAEEITFIFDAPTYLVSGTNYAFVLHATGDAKHLFQMDNTNPYADGNYGISFNSGSTWSMYDSSDFYFKTYIQVKYNILNKFNTAITVLSDDINNKFNLTIFQLPNITNKFYLKTKSIYNITNNFRMKLQSQVPVIGGLQALGKSYFTVKINNVDITESLNLNLDSLRWREVLNFASEANFVLGIPYDSNNKPNFDESVEILFNNNRKFSGNITTITKSVEPEGISIHAEGEYYNLNKEVVNFYVGRKSDESITEAYYTTYKEALSGLGFVLDIGDFVPVAESYININNADAISRIIQSCGNFAWYVDSNENKKLWQGGDGSIITLEKQSLGTNLGLYQIINHNITENQTDKIDRVKVIMGDDIKVGYDNTWRDVRYYINFKEKEDSDSTIYARPYFANVGWRDLREDQNLENDVELVYNGWRIVIPAGYTTGFPLGIKNPGIVIYANTELADENIQDVPFVVTWFNKGAIYPEGRKTHIFYIGSSPGSGIVTKILELSNLNVQYGVNYERITDVFPYSFQKTVPSNWAGDVITTVFAKVNVIIPSWNDTVYATDIANWELEKFKDTKITGSLTITFDCAEFYGLNLSKRIKCSGILDNPVNITSIDYDVGNYLVTVNVESFNYYERTVSVPIHEKIKEI